MNDYFKNVISQEVAKGQASFYLDNYQTTNVLPHILLTAGKGIGKTHFAKEVARNLTPFEAAKKPLRIINCSTIKNVKSFFNDIVLEDGYTSLFNFLKLKEFLKLIVAKTN